MDVAASSRSSEPDTGNENQGDAAAAAERAALVARTALGHGDIEGALNSARAALGTDVSCREALLIMAELSIRANNAVLTQKLLADVSRRNPGDARAKHLSRRLAARQYESGKVIPGGPAARPKHILLYTDDPGLGGVAQYNHSLLTALANENFFVTCVQTESDTPLVREQRERGIRHRWLDYDTGREFARTQTDNQRARAIFEVDRPDLIVFSDCCPFSNMAARDAAMRMGIPYMVVIGFVGAYLANGFPGVLDMLLPQHGWAKSVVAVSGENLRLLYDRFGTVPENSEVIHYGRPARFFAPVNPATRARLRAELNLPDDAVICLTTARLTAVKGFGLQLQAMLALAGRNLAEKLHLVWAGDGEERQKLSDEIERLGLTKRVRLLGHRWDVADWYDAADIFCLPSFIEGMPLAIMEAMAKGLPVVATAVSGIPEELGDTGKLLPDPHLDPQGVVQALAQTFQTWTENPNLRRQQGMKCRERAAKMFREETMTGNTLRLIKRVLGGSGSSVPKRNGSEWEGAATPSALAVQARFLLRCGHEARALASASSALSGDSSLVDAMKVMAELALRRGGGADAEKMFRRAFDFAPRDVEVVTGLAKALISQRKFGEARSLLNLALRREPVEPQLLAVSAELQEAEASCAVANVA